MIDYPFSFLSRAKAAWMVLFPRWLWGPVGGAVVGACYALDQLTTTKRGHRSGFLGCGSLETLYIMFYSVVGGLLGTLIGAAAA